MASIVYKRGPLSWGERHEEWLLDEAIDDTFPASDPVSCGQPGSIVNLRYAALEGRTRGQHSAAPKTTGWWLLLGSLAACALLLILHRGKRRDIPD